MTSQATELEIARIDQAIDANRATMLRRLHFNPDMSARQWQRCWDRCPDLWERSRDLYRQRGILQQARDEQINKEWKRQQRQARRAAISLPVPRRASSDAVRALHATGL